MKLWKISVSWGQTGEEETRWFSNKRDAQKEFNGWRRESDDFDMLDEPEAVSVATNRAGLIRFLNNH